MLQNPETTKKLHCDGCVFQARKAWNSPYLFNNLHFNHSMICNIDCNFCVQRGMSTKDQKPDYKLLPVVEQMVNSKWLAPNAFIFWAGGEPTLLKDFGPALTLADK